MSIRIVAQFQPLVVEMDLALEPLSMLSLSLKPADGTSGEARTAMERAMDGNPDDEEGN